MLNYFVLVMAAGHLLKEILSLFSQVRRNSPPYIAYYNLQGNNYNIAEIFEFLSLFTTLESEGNWCWNVPAIVSGIVTKDVPLSYWSIFSPVPSNSPISLCEIWLGPVSFSRLKCQIVFVSGRHYTTSIYSLNFHCVKSLNTMQMLSTLSELAILRLGERLGRCCVQLHCGTVSGAQFGSHLPRNYKLK